jgi:hypothetical protein
MIFLYSLIIVFIYSCLACEYDFKVYVYDLPRDLSSIRLAEEARRNSSYHVCVGCIYVSIMNHLKYHFSSNILLFRNNFH